MHPIQVVVDAILSVDMSFYLVLTGTPGDREAAGIPRSVAERELLLFSFEAQYFAGSNPQCEEDGLHCNLSFDQLYAVVIPWGLIRQVGVTCEGVGGAREEPLPDNVVNLFGRKRKELVN